MKIICTSDWHLGNLFHGYDQLEEHKHFLQWLLRQIEEQQPTALLIAGDVFDNGNPSGTAQSAYYKFLADATSICPTMQIVITAGNHDSATRLDAPRELLTRYHVEVRGTVSSSWVTDEQGHGRRHIAYDDLIIPITAVDGEQAVVLAVPYLRNDLIVGKSYSQGVTEFLQTMTRRARELYRDRPIVMMAHMYATGADIASRDASEKIIIGGQEQVNMKGWTDHPDYLTCGHIHKRQHIWDTNWARYTGSVLPMSFAEKDYTHGVDLVTIKPSQRPIVDQLVYTPRHSLQVFPKDDEICTASALKKLIKAELPERTGDKPDENAVYVSLKVAQDKIDNDQVHELEELVATKNAILCKIQKLMPQVNVSDDSKGPVMKSIDDILNRDPMETLREAFRLKHGHEMTDRQQSLLTETINNINNQSND